MARGKKWKPTKQDRKEITALIGMGLTVKDIAEVKGVCRDTLYEHCKKEIQSGRPIMKAQLVKTIFQLGLSGKNPAVTIYLTKALLGWSDKPTGNINPDELDETNPLIEAIKGTTEDDWANYEAEAPPQGEAEPDAD